MFFDLKKKRTDNVPKIDGLNCNLLNSNTTECYLDDIVIIEHVEHRIKFHKLVQRLQDAT